MRATLWLALLFSLPLPAFAQPDLKLDHMAGTDPLVLDEPLDVVMVRGINYFAERELADSPNRRAAKWNRDYSSSEAYQKSIDANRERLREILGAVDERTSAHSPDAAVVAMFEQSVSTDDEDVASVCNQVRWDVLPGITAEGEHWFNVGVRPKAHVILVPDADSAPASLFSNPDAKSDQQPVGLKFASAGCMVLSPTLLNRSDEFSGHPDVRFTNQPHREFIYRMAFEMGRHVVGYEVQKILAAVDYLEAANKKLNDELPILVAGIGEGGLLALHAAALDPRIDGVLVSGYYQEREAVWREPIYRNIWSQLTEFGDADLASLIAPRPLIIEACAVPEVSGPPAPHDGRSGGAAPGRLATAPVESVRDEFARAQVHYAKLGVVDRIQLVLSESGTGPHCSDDAIQTLLTQSGITGKGTPDIKDLKVALKRDPSAAQKRQVDELNRFTQRLMHSSDKARDKSWAKLDRTSLETATKAIDEYREWVYDTLIGRLPEPTIPFNARTRKVIDEPTHVGYEVILDLFPAGNSERPLPQADGTAVGPVAVDKDFFAGGKDWGVIAGGILLIPRDLKPGEQRPVVVCQHGLEGTPMSTIVTDPKIADWNYYKGFATELCKRGFITYAPQNPYRGTDAFRQIQRKSNPLGRSMFSYIIPQHQRTLEFLASLPYVDSTRMGFYGLSYGGKTAVRVPPMLAQGGGSRAKGQATGTNSLDPQPLPLSPGYCLSICSADYNEWVRKNTSSEDRYSYVFTGEYEIFEWNMGHVANYAELSYLMTPRPFMVERGHDDGVAPDEWVAWEFAKVKRHYDKLGIGDDTEMEVFNGPHTINGVGTYDFLHRHLNWPKR